MSTKKLDTKDSLKQKSKGWACNGGVCWSKKRFSPVVEKGETHWAPSIEVEPLYRGKKGKGERHTQEGLGQIWAKSESRDNTDMRVHGWIIRSGRIKVG